MPRYYIIEKKDLDKYPYYIAFAHWYIRNFLHQTPKSIEERNGLYVIETDGDGTVLMTPKTECTAEHMYRVFEWWFERFVGMIEALREREMEIAKKLFELVGVEA